MTVNQSKINIDWYKDEVDKIGLEKTLFELLDNQSSTGDNGVLNKSLSAEEVGSLYEIGLEHINKDNKKKLGQYYTPDDISNYMCFCLNNILKQNNNIINICDIGCGTGNLILKLIELDQTKTILKDKDIWLYDIDEAAVKICKKQIENMLHDDWYIGKIHVITGDFLSSQIKLSDYSAVISNPPYGKLDKSYKAESELVRDCRELYAGFMEKILEQSECSVIISPYSYLNGSKFYRLRQIMNKHSGSVISFDNMPASIFNGKKIGIYNTNTKNSVRASIMVTDNKGDNGYKISELIRFRAEDRKVLFKEPYQLLEEQVNKCNRQIITGSTIEQSYCKCPWYLQDINNRWRERSDQQLKDLLVKDSDYRICVPDTNRYYTVASHQDLNRAGKYVLCFRNKKMYCYAYLMLNSSFNYLWWREYDGGIKYSLSLMKCLPVFYNSLSNKNKIELCGLAESFMEEEDKYKVYKKNAGKMQENIKFPTKYIYDIDQDLLRVLGIADYTADIFTKLHQNTILN